MLERKTKRANALEATWMKRRRPVEGKWEAESASGEMTSRTRKGEGAGRQVGQALGQRKELATGLLPPSPSLSLPPPSSAALFRRPLPTPSSASLIPLHRPLFPSRYEVHLGQGLLSRAYLPPNPLLHPCCPSCFLCSRSTQFSNPVRFQPFLANNPDPPFFPFPLVIFGAAPPCRGCRVFVDSMAPRLQSIMDHGGGLLYHLPCAHPARRFGSCCCIQIQTPCFVQRQLQAPQKILSPEYLCRVERQSSDR